MSVPDLGGSLTGRSCCGPNTRRSGRRSDPYIQQQFSPMGAIGIPLLNTIILVTSGVTLTHRAPRAEGRPPRRAQVLAVRHDRAGLHVPRLPGVRVHARVQRAQPEADDGRLRLDVLHADRIPRRARDDRRDHADGDAVPRVPRATSTPSTTSRSRPPRGTGTSSTSSGCCCSCSCTGCNEAAQSFARSARTILCAGNPARTARGPLRFRAAKSGNDVRYALSRGL